MEFKKSIGSQQYDFNNNTRREPSKSNILIEKQCEIFKEFHAKILLSQSLFYGQKKAGYLFRSHSKLISPLGESIVSEMQSYIQNRMKSPALASNDTELFSGIVSSFNKILFNMYNQLNIEDSLFKAWVDYMIAGIGILKVNASKNNVLFHEHIDPLSCIWDITSSGEPSFFVHEEILSIHEACARYSISDVNYNKQFSAPSSMKTSCILNVSSFDTMLESNFSSGSGKQLQTKNLNDIYSEKNIKKLVYESPPEGYCIVRTEYHTVNVKFENDIKKVYAKNVFINNYLVDTSSVEVEDFPYILLHEKKQSYALINMYPCFFDMIKTDVLSYNIYNNLQMDTAFAGAEASGTVIVNQDAIVDKSKIDTENLQNKTLKVKMNSPDTKIGDSIIQVPPLQLSQGLSQEMQNCVTRIRLLSGLLNFDSAKLNSGYHESLRLSREFSNISRWMKVLDKAIISIGKKLINCIKVIAEKDLDKLLTFTDNKNEVIDNTEKYITLVDYARNSIKVVESKATESYKHKQFNDIMMVNQLGMQINLPISTIFKNVLNWEQDEVDKLLETNMDDGSQGMSFQAQLEESKAKAIKDVAMADKYKAEAIQIIKEVQNPTKKKD